MSAYKLTATLTEDGLLLLKDLPFHAGDAVEVIIREQPKARVSQETARDYCKVQFCVMMTHLNQRCLKGSIFQVFLKY